MFRSLAARVSKRKVKLMPYTPYASIFDSGTHSGLGVKHPETIYHTVKVKNLVDSLMTANYYCRMTTRETLSDIR